jgi:hypothetical protein
MQKTLSRTELTNGGVECNTLIKQTQKPLDTDVTIAKSGGMLLARPRINSSEIELVNIARIKRRQR